MAAFDRDPSAPLGSWENPHPWKLDVSDWEALKELRRRTVTRIRFHLRPRRQEEAGGERVWRPTPRGVPVVKGRPWAAIIAGMHVLKVFYGLTLDGALVDENDCVILTWRQLPVEDLVRLRVYLDEMWFDGTGLDERGPETPREKTKRLTRRLR